MGCWGFWGLLVFGRLFGIIRIKKDRDVRARSVGAHASPSRPLSCGPQSVLPVQALMLLYLQTPQLSPTALTAAAAVATPCARTCMPGRLPIRLAGLRASASSVMIVHNYVGRGCANTWEGAVRTHKSAVQAHGPSWPEQLHCVCFMGRGEAGLACFDQRK